MSNLIEPTPEETNGNGSGGGPNRALILIALGLAGVLVIGLLGVFGYVAGTRFGLFGARRDSPTPVVATPSLNGTRVATVPAGGTPGAVSTVSGAAATSAAATATRVAGAGTPGAATATRVAAAGTVVATSAATRVLTVVPTTVPTRGATGAPTTVAQAQPTATPTTEPTATGGTGGASAEATATPTGGGGGTQALPDTGAELDLLIIAGLLVILLVLARSFRTVLRA